MVVHCSLRYCIISRCWGHLLLGGEEVRQVQAAHHVALLEACDIPEVVGVAYRSRAR